MLTSLRVRDLAVLEDVEVALAAGLTVLTGETGAGKSLVVDALSLLAGERADATLVRGGAERLVVEGVFESDDPAVAAALAEAGLDEALSAGQLVVRREVAAGGKGRLFLGGSPAAVRTLLEVMPRLLVLYGQAEARELLDPTVPRDLLDRFAGLEPLAAEVARLFSAHRVAEAERARIAGAAADRVRRLELLDFQVNEVDAVSPRRGEDEALVRERSRLGNVERIGRLLADAGGALDSEEGGALTALAASRRALQALAEVDPAFEAEVAVLADVTERAADVARGLARALDRLEADPGRLAEVAERLDALARLKRKYGPDLDDVLRHRERIGKERDELVDLEGSLAKAEAAARVAFEAFRRAALSLSLARAAAAPRFSAAVERHLADLAFLAARFGVRLARRADADSPFLAGDERVTFGAWGIDQVTLDFAPNPGEPPRPLSKIASGGELSRVELALAAALAAEEAGRDEAPGPRSSGARTRTFVFDEIDTGVSGATAEAVGKKLRTLARRDQILVVTHLPQVAAQGDRHLFVSKAAQGGRTTTQVADLSGESRVDAIAAMLGGSAISEAARAQARELLASATSFTPEAPGAEKPTRKKK
ncbi:MAG: DNA repair protein RecN [Acidobacteria bacterium]|nr:DNA repair protein RecN [Acidobacteriota bacterium]